MISGLKHLGNNVLITLSQDATALASTVDGGLRHGIRYVIHHQVPRDFNGDPIKEVLTVHRELSIGSGWAITFLTATELPRNHVIHREFINDVEVIVSITMGLTNPYRLLRDQVLIGGLGRSTINMAIIIDKPLTVQAMIDVIALAAQVKALTLAELTGGAMHGTTSDAIAILTPSGNKEPYAGPATAVGRAIVHAVHNALVRMYEVYGAGPGFSGHP